MGGGRMTATKINPNVEHATEPLHAVAASGATVTHEEYHVYGELKMFYIALKLSAAHSAGSSMTLCTLPWTFSLCLATELCGTANVQANGTVAENFTRAVSAGGTVYVKGLGI